MSARGCSSRLLDMRAALALMITVVALPGAAQAGVCQFGPTFFALVHAIPGVVGSCVAPELVNPLNGDRLQMTQGGLLVANRLGRWTAFTAGTGRP
jgi:hypothetical protein